MSFDAIFLFMLLGTSGALADLKSDFVGPITVVKKLHERNVAAVEALLGALEMVEDLDVIGLDKEPIMQELKEKEEAARKENEPFFADTLANPRSIPDACQAIRAEQQPPSIQAIVEQCIRLHAREPRMLRGKDQLKTLVEELQRKLKKKKMDVDDRCEGMDTYMDMANCVEGAGVVAEEIYSTSIYPAQREVEKAKTFVEEAKKHKDICLNGVKASEGLWKELGELLKLVDDLFKKCVEEEGSAIS